MRYTRPVSTRCPFFLGEKPFWFSCFSNLLEATKFGPQVMHGNMSVRYIFYLGLGATCAVYIKWKVRKFI